jgi:hypothetical protein
MWALQLEVSAFYDVVPGCDAEPDNVPPERWDKLLLFLFGVTRVESASLACTGESAEIGPVVLI